MVSVAPVLPAASAWLAQENTVACCDSSPLSVSVDVQDVPEPPIVVASPSIVQTRPVTDSDAVIDSVITSVVVAFVLSALLDVIPIVSVGNVASWVKANCVAAAVLVLAALSDAAPTATSMVTDSSASVGVNV